MSRAATETLAIIAYHQPITRSEIENIRGVSLSKGTLDVLLELEWIQPGYRKSTPGKPLTWKTTNLFLDYFNLSYNVNSSSADSIANLSDNVFVNSNNDSLIVKTSSSNYPIDCVFVYKADNSSNSYEISVCLESDFFMNKKKWDGGNDDLRYEVGSDLRLDTQIIVQENGKITSSENSSIFK